MGLEVEIIADRLECSIDGKQVWSRPVTSIVLIAEYATNGGYWGDDSFLSVMFCEQGTFVDTAISDSVIGGHGVLLRALGDFLGAELDLKLPYSAKFASRVIWPEAIKDEKIYTFDPISPVGIWERLKARCFGTSLSLALTPPVLEYLRLVEHPTTSEMQELGGWGKL